MSRTPSLQNREQYHGGQMAALAEADLPAQAPALGLAVDSQGRVPVRFFGRDYLVSNAGISALDGAPVPLDHQSVLAHYLMSRGRGTLSGEFLPIGRLTGVVSTGASPSDNLIVPLTENFGGRYDLFAGAARRIGGRAEGRSPSGGESWLFPDLPFFPVRVVFFEADDEFPAEVKVLFDSSITTFVSYECLELMELVLVEELLGP
ncbi:MAG: DUF3786 domain-containing protein [Candidatus Adiutrix sp.]|jgi:hypothetical protein|nr:DUF3786 domain-containing protein [Candidatus Adiutrix sp.]